MLSSLAKNILATVVYYDTLDYPLTAFEIEKYLMRAEAKKAGGEEKFDLVNILTVIESQELKKLIEEHRGFYFLHGCQDLVAQRIERNKISEKKIKIVLKVVRWLRFVPFLRMIAVTGRLAMKNTEARSDLDLLIVIKKSWIFTGRLLITALIHLLGKRRYAEKITDRICLNHFITDDFKITIQSLFSANEYVFLLPVFGNFSGFYARNTWMKEFKPNFYPDGESVRIIKDTQFSKMTRNFLEKTLSFKFIENALANWQEKRIRKNPKTQQKGSVIICKNQELAFWPNFANQETRIMEKFSLKLGSLLNQSRNL